MLSIQIKMQKKNIGYDGIRTHNLDFGEGFRDLFTGTSLLMFKQLIHYLAKKQNNITVCTVLNFNAVFHFCLQINKANIIERYIHYMSITNTIAIYLIFLAYINFTKFENLIKYCCCRPRLTSLFP